MRRKDEHVDKYREARPLLDWARTYLVNIDTNGLFMPSITQCIYILTIRHKRKYAHDVQGVRSP